MPVMVQIHEALAGTVCLLTRHGVEALCIHRMEGQRRRPTLTSISTSCTPLARAARSVSGESTATVMRAPDATSWPSRCSFSTSFANSRSSPRPAAAIPSHSRIVAQVKFR